VADSACVERGLERTGRGDHECGSSSQIQQTLGNGLGLDVADAEDFELS
jgi:hypothetical protein